MNFNHLHFACIDQLHEVCLFQEDNVLQLSPGPLDFFSTQIELEGIQLQWNRVGASILSREEYPGPGVMFGFVLQSPAPLRSFGHELDYGYALVWPARKHLEYVAPTGLASLVIQADEALADMLGWTLRGDAWRQVPTPRLRKLEHTCRLATQALSKRISGGYMAADARPLNDGLWWRDRILGDLEAALAPWLTPPVPLGKATLIGTHSFQLFNKAARLLERRDMDQPFFVDEIAEVLGVPRRTMFHAFRKSLGIGPHAYLQLVRLHRFRRRLVAATAAETTVTALATESGFYHLGRLSALYRKYFREYPQDTLKRQ